MARRTRVNRQTVVSRSERVAFQRIEGGGVLLHLDTGAYHRVNSVGALVWEALGESKDLSEVMDNVERSVEGPAPSDLFADVETFLKSLAQRDLVVVAEG
jgi:hypothetical protein